MNVTTDESGARAEDRLGALLTAAAPTGALPTDDRVAELSLALARQVVDADRGARGRFRALRRRRKAVALAATAAIAFVPTGAWAAQHFLAQTGRFGSADAGGLRDGSEWIDMCARDFTRYVATLTPSDLPAAPQHSWAQYAARVAASEVSGAGCAATTEAAQQSSNLRASLVALATSDWGCALVRANRSGDAAGELVARAAMNDLNARAEQLTPGSGAGYPPDTFLANSRRPDFTGCRQ